VRKDPNKQPLVVPGRISIARYQNADEGDLAIHVELTDDVSRTIVASFAMRLADFAKAVTGQGELHGELTIYVGAPWGKQHETKTMPVQVPKHNEYHLQPDGRGRDRAKWEADLTAALRIHERDGWQANRRDAENWHNHLRFSDGRLFHGHEDRPFDQERYARPGDDREYYLVHFHRHVEKGAPDEVRDPASAE